MFFNHLDPNTLFNANPNTLFNAYYLKHSTHWIMVRKNFYVAGKSGDSWYQLPPSVRQKYKITLAKMYGSRCNSSFGHSSFRCANNRSSKVGCGNPFPIALLTVDHIIPISKGGPVFDIGNMQLLCRECHKKKTTEIDMMDF